MASRQCVLAMELEDIEREKFDRSLAKHQIRQYFPPSINCAIRYVLIQMINFIVAIVLVQQDTILLLISSSREDIAGTTV